jgi:hypothetical protein
MTSLNNITIQLYRMSSLSSQSDQFFTLLAYMFVQYY